MKTGEIKVNSLSKVYKIYNKPIDRLKESVNIKGKGYHTSFHALNNVSFSINRGETVGIIGKNGSGKSTLLKVLAGVLSPSSGDIQIKGKVSAILELGAGFNVEYSGIENIYLNGTILGKTKAEMDNKLNDILEFADIGDFIYQPVKTYSSGMFARLAFAVAINVDPDILIVDEALAVGDMKFQTKCFSKFEELKSRGVTILFVGHDISSIRKFCDRTMWINHGELLLFGDTLAVTAEYMEFMNTEKDITSSMDVDKENTITKADAVTDTDDIAKPISDIINRWGSQPHLVQSVRVVNEKGNETNIIKHGEVIRIIINFDFPVTVNPEDVSVAISFKNTMGLDLLVLTTHDIQNSKLKFDKVNEAVFEFVNYFNEGDFVLVVAIEDRSSIQPVYFDYIEGAGYLKCLADQQLFGLMHTPFRVYLRK